MGFFDRFRGDTVARAERQLEGGDPRAALATLAKDDSEAAASLRTRARDALVANLLERAKGAEQEGYLSDAMDWLRTASEEAPVGSKQHAAITEQLEKLAAAVEKDAQAETADVPPAFDLRAQAPIEATDPDQDPLEGAAHVDDLFEGLASMLREDVADRYFDQPAAFRQAWILLNEGQVRAALDGLTVLGDDPVVRFERGRAHWALGEARAAIEHFEVAWEVLGDQPFDLSGNQSLPQLWAEAMLDLDQAEPVVDRLAPLVTTPATSELPAMSTPRGDLAEPFGRALIGAGRARDAIAFLTTASELLPRQNDLRLTLANAHDAAGEPMAAIDELERVIAPSCTTGTCSRPPLDIAAVRAVVGRYLDLDQDECRGDWVDKAREHLERMIVARQGSLAVEDCGLLARYFVAIEEPEMAAQAEAAAASGEARGVAIEGLSLAPRGDGPSGGAAGFAGGNTALG